MVDQQLTEKQWNIFARELERVLAAHHLQMDDLVTQAGVSPEKTRRLARSLRIPEALPVLHREAVRLLERRLQLNAEEILRLRAALLATCIQRMFVDRINQHDAFLLAEQAFPTILHALQERAQGPVVHEGTRWGAGDPIEDDEIEALFASTLRTLDDAELELQMSYGVDDHETRVAQALSAQTHFAQVSVGLEKADEDVRSLHLWKDSYETSQRGLENANKRLEELGH